MGFVNFQNSINLRLQIVQIVQCLIYQLGRFEMLSNQLFKMSDTCNVLHSFNEQSSAAPLRHQETTLQNKQQECEAKKIAGKPASCHKISMGTICSTKNWLSCWQVKGTHLSVFHVCPFSPFPFKVSPLLSPINIIPIALYLFSLLQGSFHPKPSCALLE